MAALGGPQNQREVFVDRSRHDVSASTAVSAGIVTTPNLTVDLTRSAPVISAPDRRPYPGWPSRPRRPGSKR